MLKPGDAYILRSGGGGGFATPLERPPEAVADDVRQGYVSREAAAELYGVILMSGGDVDVAATDRSGRHCMRPGCRSICPRKRRPPSRSTRTITPTPWTTPS